MKIQQFDGGLSTRTEPQFLNTNQGTVYENIDNASGILKPLKMPAPAGIFVKPFHTFFDYNQEWVDSDLRRDYVEYQRKLYWTDRITAPQKYDGTTQANLGIIPPPQLTGITVTPSVDVTSVVTEVTSPPVNPAQTLLARDAHYLVFTSDEGIPVGFETADKQVSTGRILSVSAAGVVAVDTEVVPLTAVPARPVAATETIVTRTVAFSEMLGGDLPDPAATVYAYVFRYFGGDWRYVGGAVVIPSEPFLSWPTVLDGLEDLSARETLDEFLADVILGFPYSNKYLVPKLDGVYQYQTTYYNSADGTESGPSLFSSEIDLTSRGYTKVTLAASADPQVDKIRLYRVGGDVTTSTLVAEFSNTGGFITDNKADNDLAGTLLSSSIAFNPPIGLAFLTTAYAMLFAAEESKLRFTPIGDPNSWPELYFLEFDLDITGIAAVSNGILVFTKYETHLVTGTGPNALSKQRLSADQGCLAFESIQVMGGAALWVSTDGICTSGGGPVMVVSKQTLGKYSVDATASAVFDESYYVLDSGGTVTQFDFAYGKVYKTQTPGVTSLAIANDVLYGVSGGELQAFYAGTEATMKYKSPRFIEGSVTEQKRYKKFTVYHEGDIIIKVYIDNILVTTKTLTGIDSTEFQVPSEQQRGFFVQFEVEGVGTVHEIEYEVGRT
tara:strand:+ start:10214 stop:12217 length:2004 start_codon:yes stop_codon:yes gene_type:complete